MGSASPSDDTPDALSSHTESETDASASETTEISLQEESSLTATQTDTESPPTTGPTPETGPDADSPFDGAESPPASDLEVMRALDSFLDDIDTDLPTARERTRARDHFELEDKLGGATTTQEKLGFDYVRDDGIAVDGDSYIGLLKVHPQNWLSLSDQRKRDTMSAYMSFLMALESSVAIPCYPKTFDLTGHLERFYTAGASMASRGQTPILQYGRKFYIQWASTNIEDEDLKQRDFYIVTRVEAEHVHKNLKTGSALSQLGTLPLVGGLCSRLARQLPWVETHEAARTELCIREVHQRQRRIMNTLGRTDVSLERVTDRQETMEILYHYYNHVDPGFERFDHATKSQGDR